MKFIRVIPPFLLFLALKPCSADPIPVPPLPAHLIFIQLTLPVLINYLWNLLILSAVFTLFGTKVKSEEFLLFILALTLAGLMIDVATLSVFKASFNFYGWVLIVSILLFALSFNLTKLFYKLPKQKCAISGIIYAVASHPIVGITFIIPILAKFSLVPPL